MLFKDVKTGYTVYILHKGDEVKVSHGKAVSVSMPHIPNMPVPSATQQLVVDVTIEEDGSNKTYTIPETLETTYAGSDLVISTGREGILREVEALKSRAEEVLASVDRNKHTIESCEKILTEFNPVFKEKKATEERFGKIEDQLGEVAQMVKNLVSKLS